MILNVSIYNVYDIDKTAQGNVPLVSPIIRKTDFNGKNNDPAPLASASFQWKHFNATQWQMLADKILGKPNGADAAAKSSYQPIFTESPVAWKPFKPLKPVPKPALTRIPIATYTESVDNQLAALWDSKPVLKPDLAVKRCLETLERELTVEQFELELRRIILKKKLQANSILPVPADTNDDKSPENYIETAIKNDNQPRVTPALCPKGEKSLKIIQGGSLKTA